MKFDILWLSSRTRPVCKSHRRPRANAAFIPAPWHTMQYIVGSKKQEREKAMQQDTAKDRLPNELPSLSLWSDFISRVKMSVEWGWFKTRAQPSSDIANLTTCENQVKRYNFKERFSAMTPFNFGCCTVKECKQQSPDTTKTNSRLTN